MEERPVPDGTVDVVISNGVLNLSPRKSRALAEAARVLRPGGRLCFADLIVEGELPPEVLASPAAWAGCIAGAVSERVLRRKLVRAGFTGIEVTGHVPFTLDDVALYPLFTEDVVDLMRQLLPQSALEQIAIGVIVHGRLADGRDDPLPVATPLSAASGARPLDAIIPDAVEAPGVTIRHLKGVEDAQLKVLDVEPGGLHPTPHPRACPRGRGDRRPRKVTARRC
jgi:hypothetical protein